MAVQFIFGASGAGKTEYILREFVTKAPANLCKPWLIIVPEQDTLAMQKRVISHPENKARKGIINIDVLSFNRLAYRVFEELTMPVPRIIDDTGKVMILRKVAEDIKDKLTLYTHQLNKPGFLDELKSQISEFYQYRILPEMLDLAAEHAESLYTKGKLHDLALIYETFRNYMEEHGYMTEEELLDRLYQYLPETKLIDGAVIALDGFTGFTPIQKNVLEEMMLVADRVEFCLDLGRRDNSTAHSPKTPEELFYLTGKTVQTVTELAEKNNISILPDINLNLYDAVTGEVRSPFLRLPRFEKLPELDFLEQNLYRFDGVIEKFPGKPEGMEIWEAPDQRREMEAIATEIERLVREEHFRYQEISILLTEPEAYRDIVYKTFSEADIPYFFDDPGSLLDSPYAEVMRAALEVIDRDFTFDSVLRYLRALPGSSPMEEDLVDQFDNFLRERGIRGVSRYQSVWDEHEDLRQKFMLPLLTMRDKISDRNAAISVRVQALKELLEEISARQLVTEEAEALQEEGDQNRAEELRQGMDAIDEVLMRITELLGETKASRTEFRDILEAGLKQASIRVIPATLDQVLIGDLTRSRFANPRLFFIAGITADRIPKAESDQKLLGDRDRALFKELGMELAPDRVENALIQRFYIYRALLNPRDRLILSYPMRGRDGKGQKASSLILELKRFFPGLRIHSLRSEARRIYTRKEALRAIAENMPGLLEAANASEEQSHTEAWEKTIRYFALLYRDPDYRDAARQLLTAAFTRYSGNQLDPRVAMEVYGSVLEGSITRLEQYRQCAYAHFLHYGLRLMERKTYEVQAFDIGNLYHAAIELCFRLAEEMGKTISELTEQELTELANESVARVSSQYSHSMMLDSARNQYIVRKVRKVTKTTLWALAEQLRRGDFKVVGVEKSFDFVRDGIRLHGRIDRIDRCEDEEHVYVRVIDYKTGATSFDLAKIYDGQQIQLATYLNVALTKAAIRFSEKEIVPAGMFYYHIDDPVLNGEDLTAAKDLSEARLRTLRMDGLVNTSLDAVRHMDRTIQKESDIIPVTVKNGMVDEKKKSVAPTERFMALGQYVDRQIRQDAAEIKEGRISIDPVRLDAKYTACSFCPYHAVCGFDPRIAGFAYRTGIKAKPEEIWERIENDSNVDRGSEEGHKS